MNDIRWKQRFQNFDRVFILLRSALEDQPLDQLSDLEQEGVIQRFEYSYELAWKTIKTNVRCRMSGDRWIQAVPGIRACLLRQPPP